PRRTTIRSHSSFLRLYLSRALFGPPRRHGCSNGIRKSHAGDDHRSRRCAPGAHMSKISRRQFVTAGLAATAGVSGLAVAANLGRRFGLVPPDSGGIYGPGETLTYGAEWIGTPLSEVLKASGILPQARYLVYFSIDPDWWDSIDLADAQHPQTLLAWAMNDGDLPVAFGGPLRLRLPRQLGYKSIKFVTRVMVTDSVKGFVPARDPKHQNNGYAWYAGI